MVGEFDLPNEIVDRKVTKMKMISPSNREVDVGKTLSESEYIGMCRREVLDDFLRQRAKKYGTKVCVEGVSVMAANECCRLRKVLATHHNTRLWGCLLLVWE